MRRWERVKGNVKAVACFAAISLGLGLGVVAELCCGV